MGVRGVLILALWPLFLFGEIESLPLICVKILEKPGLHPVILSPAQVDQLLHLANEDKTKQAMKLSLVEPETLGAWAQQVLSLKTNFRNLEIKDRFLMDFSELQKRMPELKTAGPLPDNLRKAMARDLLESDLEQLSFAIANEFGKRATSKQKKQFYQKIISEIDHYGKSWYHQGKVDRVLDAASGVQSEQITNLIKSRDPEEQRRANQGEETYASAGNGMLLTPHHDIRDLLRLLKPTAGQTIVDLGSGYGRMGVYVGITQPGVNFYGYEIVKERSAEAARAAKELGLGNVHMVEQNLADPQFKPVAADIYYAFNPVRGATFDKILDDLKTVGLHSGKRFKFVVTGPAPYEKCEAQPWLREVKHEGAPQSKYLRIYEFVPEAIEIEKHLPTYPAFRALTKEDEPLVDAILQKDKPQFSLFTHNSLFAWNSISKFEVSQKKGALLIRFGEGPEKGMLLEPSGVSSAEKVSILNEILSSPPDKTPTVGYLSQEVAQKMKDQGTGTVTLEKDLSDYIYSAKDLVDLKRTKALRDRRNQMERFYQRMPGTQAKRIVATTKVQRRGLDDFLENWGKSRLAAAEEKLKGQDPVSSQMLLQKTRDELAVTKHLENRLGPDSLKVTLENDGKVLAYAFGEVVKMKVTNEPQPVEVFVLYVMKADTVDRNVYQAMNHALAKEVAKDPRFKNVAYFNFMDDWGNLGIRRFKEDYSPVGYGSNYVLRPLGQTNPTTPILTPESP